MSGRVLINILTNVGRCKCVISLAMILLLLQLNIVNPDTDNPDADYPEIDNPQVLLSRNTFFKR